MPSISKIRFTNVVFENGGKRFNDDIFQFDGNNGSILLENGGGKTVFIQTALQVILPHYNLEERRIRDTLSLESGPCHIAIEWILNERPRRYLTTVVTLFLANNRLDSYKYTYEYDYQDNHSIEKIPFVIKGQEGRKRPASKGEMADYYQGMKARNMNAKFFNTIKEYHQYIEENYNIIPSEWRSIGLINSAEGGVENYFENCKTTNQLVNQLLIPIVEEAISENGKKDFADIFEKQRERFKKHKQLRERIKESQLIENKIIEYVQAFENYYVTEMNYLEKQQYAKAINLYIKQEGKRLEAELLKNQEDAEDIQELFNELNKKEASFELAVLDKNLEKHLEETKELEKNFYELKNKFDDNTSMYHSLKIAKFKQDLKEVEESIRNNQEQLKRLTEDPDLESRKQELEENSLELRGYFLKEEKVIVDKIEEINLEKDKFQQKFKVHAKNQKRLLNLKDIQLSEYNQKKGQLDEMEKELQRIEKSIYGLDLNTDKHQQLQNWMKKVGELEETSANKNTEINKLKIKRLSLENDLKNDRFDLGNLENKKTLLNEKISVIIKEHDNLFLKLKMLNTHWYHYDSLYKRERTIISHLKSKIDIFNNEKEELLLEERRAGRFKDDYENHKRFTVEPLIEKWVSQWKEKFILIETGTQYLQRAAKELQQTEEEFLQLYPYWPLAIIVEDSEIHKIEEEIKMQVDQIVYPILIIGQQEAISIIKDKTFIEERMIFPKHWPENVNQELFEKWKVKMMEKVAELIKARKEKEKLIQEYNQYFTDVDAFFCKHPYEGFANLKNNLVTVQENIEKLTLQINEQEETLVAIQEDCERYRKDIDNYKDEINLLTQNIQAIHQYITKEREVEQIILAINQIEEKVEKLEKDIAKVNYELANIEEEIEIFEEEYRNFNGKLKGLKKDTLYIEVQNVEPKFNDRSRVGLEEERNNLLDLLNQKESSYKHIEQALKKDNKRKKELIKDIERARKETDVPIDEIIDYNLYGEEQLEYLLGMLNKLGPIKTEKEEILRDKKEHYQKLLTQIDLLKKQFFEKYDQIFLFEASLDQEKVNLANERKILSERKEENESLSQLLSKEEKDIAEGIRILAIENGKYEYMAEGIKAIALVQNFYRDFPYRRLAFIEEIIAVLKGLKETRENAFLKLDEHKKDFIDYCDEEITDPRLRERTVAGIRQKNNYEEILKWQNRMKKSIQHTIRVAEDDMREHDKDLEQYVNHLFTYLRTITDELRMIPKKTRIKVDEKWKEIYVFNVPEWGEEEGKEEIRKHIDWMLHELENYQFKNEDDTENIASIRKEIERWLGVKQLLPIVLKNNVIKVSCRKVTNDNKISSSLTTWESSNRWSGGEKWSKNMTLFLGILNYVAERRQGIADGVKTNRTVIMDNPFGKASSDHVLDPVFYISEKLGFQIIALTAHSEGSFIRNYFPVVYSCRLREAVNNKTLIIDKEKEIRHAFFKDKNPDSLYRLQEHNQLNLF